MPLNSKYLQDCYHGYHRWCFHFLFLLLLTLSTLEETRAQPCPKTWDNAGQFNVPSFFYQFDPSSDGVVPPSDDGNSSEINLTFFFPFFGQFRTSLYIGTNGVIFFGHPTSIFAIDELSETIGPFVIDLDTTVNNGRIYYRQTTDPLLLCRISGYVKEKRLDASTFEATWVFIATWHNVTYFEGNTSTPVNTFQVVLATDGHFGFALFNYGDIANVSGLTGRTPAHVGFYSGSPSNFYAIEISEMSAVVNLDILLGNTKDTARWLFRIDTSTITDHADFSTVSVRENRAVTLNCPSAGVKFSSRSWNRGLLTIVGPYTLLYRQLKTGTVSSDGARSDMSLDADTFQLTINKPQAIEDVNFTCTVFNEETQMRTLYYIRLRYDGVDLELDDSGQDDSGQSNLVPIAAGAGGGGGLVLIIIIIVLSVILCRQRRARIDTRQNQRTLPLEEVGMKGNKSATKVGPLQGQPTHPSEGVRTKGTRTKESAAFRESRNGYMTPIPHEPTKAQLDLPDDQYETLTADIYYEEIIG